jgi:hypothetical protein
VDEAGAGRRAVPGRITAVLLSSDYWEAELAYPSIAIAYWTRASGTVLLPRGGWPIVAVRDINNQGVIAGCAGESVLALQAAFWRIH